MENGILKIQTLVTLEVNYQELAGVEIDKTQKALDQVIKKKYSPRKGVVEVKKYVPMQKGSLSPNRDFHATASDFHCMRIILRGWRSTGKLNENELDVLAGYGSKRFKTMTPEEKQNFIDFFKSIVLRINQLKALK